MANNLKQYEYYRTKNGVLYCADCLTIMPQLGPVDFVLTDPPYGMDLDTDFSKMGNKNFKGKTKGTEYDLVIGDNKEFNPSMIMQFTQNSKDEIWFGADYYCQHIKIKNSGSWQVWDKRLTASANKMFGSCFELIWTKKKHKREVWRYKWAGIYGMEHQDTKKRVHPTQKPIGLFIQILSKYALPGWTILDPFAGSGTTGVACERLGGHKYTLIEYEEKYCEIAAKRIERETQQLKLF